MFLKANLIWLQAWDSLGRPNPLSARRRVHPTTRWTSSVHRTIWRSRPRILGLQQTVPQLQITFILFRLPRQQYRHIMMPSAPQLSRGYRVSYTNWHACISCHYVAQFAICSINWKLCAYRSEQKYCSKFYPLLGTSHTAVLVWYTDFGIHYLIRSVLKDEMLMLKKILYWLFHRLTVVNRVRFSAVDCWINVFESVYCWL